MKSNIRIAGSYWPTRLTMTPDIRNHPLFTSSHTGLSQRGGPAPQRPSGIEPQLCSVSERRAARPATRRLSDSEGEPTVPRCQTTITQCDMTLTAAKAELRTTVLSPPEPAWLGACPGGTGSARPPGRVACQGPPGY
eukprot:766858-Hanusia_phi.AAC.6